MSRLTEKTIGCFKFDLKEHRHVAREFNTYDAFYNYSMAVKRLGEYEESGLTPEEVKILRDKLDKINNLAVGWQEIETGRAETWATVDEIYNMSLLPEEGKDNA